MRNATVKRWAAAATMALAVAHPPSAVADPAQIPDLSRYAPLRYEDYPQYNDYPGWVGLQFLTPSGYRCRLKYNQKPNASIAECWGALPATSSNLVRTSNRGPTTFDTKDLTEQEQYRRSDGTAAVVPISPDTYKLLPAGSSITAPDLGTCAVTSTTTTCETGSHGFILDPQGNHSF